MQRIYEPENLMEGELLQQMLASEGIEAHLVGRRRPRADYRLHGRAADARR